MNTWMNLDAAWRRRGRRGLLMACGLVLLALAGCGGGGETLPPPLAATDGAATIGKAGGQVSEASGALIVVPAGALTTDTTLRLAQDSVGAPAVPSTLGLLSPIYSATPHGVRFSQPAEIRIPIDPALAASSANALLMTAEPGGGWKYLMSARREGDVFVAEVSTFSYFVVASCTWYGTIGDPANPPGSSCGPDQTISIQVSMPFAETDPALVGPHLQRAIATIKQPRTVPVQISTTGGFWFNFEIFFNGPAGRRSILSGALTQAQTTVDIPVLEADNGYQRVEVEVTCFRARSGSSCDSKIVSRAQGTTDFKFLVGGPFLEVAISAGSIPVPGALPVITSQPSDVTVAPGNTSGVVYGVSVAQTEVWHYWQASTDGGVRWSELGPYPIELGCFSWTPFGSCNYYRMPPHTAVSSSFNPTETYCPTDPAGCIGMVVRARLHNVFGDVFTRVATLTVATPAAPALTAPQLSSQPQSLTVIEGQTFSFTASATGNPSPTYSWQILAPGTSEWADVSPGGTVYTYSGGSTYSLPAANLSQTGSQYRLVATNSAGTTYSDPATLTVTGTPVVPVIVTQPQPISVVAGSTALFAAGVSGTAPLSYQWLRDGVSITGANAPVLRLDAVDVALSGGMYRLRVTNSVGEALSAAVALGVTPAPASQDPVITTSPAPVSGIEGASATFSVVATGSQLRYQWTRNKVAISGATSASYTVTPLALSDSGSLFNVIVYNATGLSISGSAVLTVVTAPVSFAQATSNLSGAPSSGTVDLPSISTDATRVGFRSDATDLVAGSLGGSAMHGFVRDVTAGTTQLVNVTTGGGTSSRGVGWMKLSGNGRYVVFTSFANDLVPGDTNVAEDVFVRDLQTGTTRRVNVLPDGSQDTVSGGSGAKHDISADGRYVLMCWSADLAVTGQSTSDYGYYLRDMTTGVTSAVPLTGATLGCNGTISADGTVVAVLTNPSPGFIALEYYTVATNTTATAFTTTTTDNLSTGSAGKLAMSSDGRYIAFMAQSPTWFSGAAATNLQVAVFDRQASGTLEQKLTLASTGANGAANGGSDYPSISGDGRYVSFQTKAGNLTGNVANNSNKVIVVRDTQAGTVSIASRNSSGTAVGTPAIPQAISGNGAGLTFVADAPAMLGPSASGAPPQVFRVPRP